MADDTRDQTAKPPAQIPLLEDIVFEPAAQVKPRAKKESAGQTSEPVRDSKQHEIKQPQPTDLFADTFPPGPPISSDETDDLNDTNLDVSNRLEQPLSNPSVASADAYFAAQITEHELRDRTTNMVDSLVKEYSKEIVRRLQDELSQILTELDENPTSSGHSTPPHTPIPDDD